MKVKKETVKQEFKISPNQIRRKYEPNMEQT